LKGVSDIVTEADTRSESLLVRLISGAFPDDVIISEEKDAALEHSSKLQDTYSWVIDPLDGTRNFSIGNPNFVVPLGILKGKEIIGGVVYFPILDEYFIADEGQAYYNDSVITVNKTTLKAAIVGFWDKREKDPSYPKVDILNKLRGKVKVLRMFGASALEKSWVACGQTDLYIGNSSSLFGAIAGVALVRSAGGVALNLEGDEWMPGDVGIICGEKTLVSEALQELSK
jgi:myo-inositol-1(or 4)-monophosphatase